MKVETGDIIIIVLHNPREKIIGVLDEINASGVFVRGIDLNAFDDWCRAIANNEPFYSMQNYFFPMWRIERITQDEDSAEVPSMAQQFSQRTGLNIEDF
ncbi:MAG: hypothetical protein K1X72_15185 [Pyrinomonadaceae bacterium]|nr:hypothetical protein [Pyrinomonadaceae bacterium]